MPEKLNEIKTIVIFSDWYVPGYKAGGPIQSVYNLACLLSKKMHVKVVCSNRDLNANEPYSGIISNTWTLIAPQHEVYYLEVTGSKLGIIKQIVKENKDSILYINGIYSFYFSILPAFLAMFYKISTCMISVRGMLHASALSVKPFKKHLFLAFARGFGLYKKSILLSSGEAESIEIQKVFGKVEIKEVPNIPLLPENIVSEKRNYPVNNQHYSFLFLGRISPEKNPIGLIKALRLIQLPCKVTFCGSSLENSYLNAFKEELLNLPASVQAEYIGDLPHSSIGKLFNTHDVMVLPSLGENFGHSIFESFVYSTPVIIGNNTPWKNIESNYAGIEVDPNNEQELAAAMQKFITMPSDDYQIWCKGARKAAELYFETSKFEEVYFNVFNS